jgi:Rrf2 family iron-sulfur cluster assembly transcriptional regulator
MIALKCRSAIDALARVGAGNGRPRALAQIAAELELSVSYLEQIFSVLRRAGLVVSTRGPGGGYTLGPAAHSMSIARICTLLGAAPARADGGNQAPWDSVERDLAGVLDRYTLGDMLPRARAPIGRAQTSIAQESI